MKLNILSGLIIALALIITVGAAGCTPAATGTSTTTAAAAATPQATTPVITQIPYQQEIIELVRNSPTFAFDGLDGTIAIRSVSSTGNAGDPPLEWEFSVDFQTAHPGHGDRSGQMLAQVITPHTALIKVENGVITSAMCDGEWDLLTERAPAETVAGTVIDITDSASPDGPLDTPRVFVYTLRQADEERVKVSYTAYPPSPAGDAAREKITLDFGGGTVNIGDRMEASGTMDKENQTLKVENQGDFIKTKPAPALPITSEEVGWQIGETAVAATLTRPEDTNRHPAVVLVAGSGPTDRDWNSPLLPGTNGSARLMAEELARSGFVTLRYDKRVTGPNAEKNMPYLTGQISMEGHVAELAGAVDLLLSRPEVDPQKIFVLANSEGTIHALNYQITREPRFAGLILDGMPGRNMADLLRAQLAPQIASLPDSEQVLAGYDRLMADFLAGQPFAADPAVPDWLNNLFQGFNVPINLPFTRELFSLDPAPLLGQVDAPILVIIGQKDIQVDFELDAQPLLTAAEGHTNISFVYPENANHVLKYEPRPREALSAADALNYNAAEAVLDPQSLRIITGWLIQRS